MFEDIDGFDWDGGNWPKCGKHGVERKEIEEMLLSTPLFLDDPCVVEKRTRAIGTASTQRYIFVVFIFRTVAGRKLIRPISARYMHQREIERYAAYKP